jgi:hypothetical protein
MRHAEDALFRIKVVLKLISEMDADHLDSAVVVERSQDGCGIGFPTPPLASCKCHASVTHKRKVKRTKVLSPKVSCSCDSEGGVTASSPSASQDKLNLDRAPALHLLKKSEPETSSYMESDHKVIRQSPIRF